MRERRADLPADAESTKSEKCARPRTGSKFWSRCVALPAGAPNHESVGKLAERPPSARQAWRSLPLTNVPGRYSSFASVLANGVSIPKNPGFVAPVKIGP